MATKTKLEELQLKLAIAHAELIKAQDAEDADAIYDWQQEVSALVKLVVQESISRPFTAYENEYGDYPI
jgi:hypothetical protein